MSFVKRWLAGSLLFAVATIFAGALVISIAPRWGYFIRGVNRHVAVFVAIIIGLAYGIFLAACWLWPEKERGK